MEMNVQEFNRLQTNERIDYIQKVHARLHAAWTSTTTNQSRMRAMFRRWNPEHDPEPTNEMRGYVWGWVGSPYTQPELETEVGNNESVDQDSEANATTLTKRERDDEVGLVDEAAIVTALRACSGDIDGDGTFGEALYHAGLSDLRLMRMLTERPERRSLMLQRMMRLLAAKNKGFAWSRKETTNFYNFLFARDQRFAQGAANNWAADFFRARGKMANEDKAAASDEIPA